MKDIRTIKEIVENVLNTYPETKDNDALLVIKTWEIELKANYTTNIENISLNQFFKVYLEGKVSNHESITRARRKLQEAIPELRGANYNLRHNFTEEVIHQVKTFFQKKEEIIPEIKIEQNNQNIIKQQKPEQGKLFDF